MRQGNYRRYSRPVRQRSGRGNTKIRLIIGLAVAAFAILSFFSSRTHNDITGENQYINLTQEQEITLGQQAVPEMAAQHGGLYPDPELQSYLNNVGSDLVNSNTTLRNSGWHFEFHLLADEQVVNAFALPGGQIFMTTALYDRLETEAQVAGVLGHEIGHVVARHGAQRISQSQLLQGLTQAVFVASDSASSAQMAELIGSMVNMKYGRDDEIQSDVLGVRFMVDAGYDPRALITVMGVLKEASGGQAPPEFFSSHPDPDNRIGRIEEAIAQEFPDGVPDNLIQ